MKQSIIVGLVSGLVVLLGVFLLTSKSSLLGGTTNFNDLSVDSITNAGTLTQTGQISAAGITNSSGTSIGSGTNITKATCGTATYNPPSLGQAGTSSVPVTVTGATIAQNQVYFVGFATSTFSVQLTGSASGTTGIVMVNFENNASSSVANIDLATSTVSACYLQF